MSNVDPFENFKKRKSEDDRMERKNLPNENVGKVSNYFSVPEQLKQQPQEAPASSKPAESSGKASSNSAVRRLEALTQLLIRKGVITEEELKMMLDLLDR